MCGVSYKKTTLNSYIFLYFHKVSLRGQDVTICCRMKSTEKENHGDKRLYTDNKS